MSLQQQQQQQQEQAPRVVDVFEDKKGKLFVKTFLIDSSINRAKWRIEKDYIPKHIDKFVGRPYILTPDRYHPSYDGIVANYDDIQGTIGHLLQAQEKYRIGTIRKVEQLSSADDSSVSQASSPTWAAYVEITDPTAIAAFKAGHIPAYVSPAILRLNKNEPVEVTTDYEPLHLAAVDYPAYGVHKATVKGSCEGDLIVCSKQLAQAAVTLPVEDCGFCIKGALEGFANKAQVNSSYLTFPVNQASDNLTENSVNESVPAPTTTTTTTQQTHEQQPSSQQQPQQQQQPPIAPNNTGTGQPFQRVVSEEKREEEIKPAKGNKEGQVEGSNRTENNNADNKSKDEVASLKATVEALLNKVNDLESFKKTSEKTQAEKKTAEKKTKIENAIPENYANSPEERTKAIDSLMKVSDGPELDYLLEKFVTPVAQSNNKKEERRGVKQAASDITTRAKNLTDFADTHKGNNNGGSSTGVSQAGDMIVDMRRISRICSMTDIVAKGGSF